MGCWTPCKNLPRRRGRSFHWTYAPRFPLEQFEGNASGRKRFWRLRSSEIGLWHMEYIRVCWNRWSRTYLLSFLNIPRLPHKNLIFSPGGLYIPPVLVYFSFQKPLLDPEEPVLSYTPTGQCIRAYRATGAMTWDVSRLNSIPKRSSRLQSSPSTPSPFVRLYNRASHVPLVHFKANLMLVSWGRHLYQNDQTPGKGQ